MSRAGETAPHGDVLPSVESVKEIARTKGKTIKPGPIKCAHTHNTVEEIAHSTVKRTVILKKRE